MELTLTILGAVLLLAGLVGCVVPVLPGPILSYCALLVLLPTEKSPSSTLLVVSGSLVALVTVADYVVPALGAKKFDCSKLGTVGCFVGTFAGMFFLPLGLLAGPFLGAFIGEVISGKRLGAALKGGVGALLGFLSGLVLKLAVCGFLTAAFVFSVR